IVICHGETRMKKLIAFSIVIIFTLCVVLRAQWAKVPPAKIPRTPEGKPNLSAPAPKLPDGKPDLSGIWEPLNNRYVQNIAADLKPEDVPYQPWAKALFDERKTGAHSKEDHRQLPASGSASYRRGARAMEAGSNAGIHCCHL